MPGIYIHIPFCKQACYYCNFHFSTSGKLMQPFTRALIKEIELTPFFASPGEPVETVYFGGGTPSILETDDLKHIFDALYKKFPISPTAEITLEANPDNMDSRKLAEWEKLNINRLSIGIQSFHDEELKWFNRAHSAKEAFWCIQKTKDAGFSNFSVDLIYGSPLSTDEIWKKNVEIILNENVPHVSCYALTVEPKTALDKMIELKKKTGTDAGKQANQFLSLMDWMQAAGYEHYEISNFSKPGSRSKHNSSYWQGIPYYGLGPSAHSYNGKCRRWNIANNALYIQSIEKNTLPYEEELLTPVQQLNEYIMISLRTMEGLDLNLVEKRFGEIKKKKLKIKSEKWMQTLHLTLFNSHLILSKEGKLFADGIAVDLFF